MGLLMFFPWSCRRRKRTTPRGRHCPPRWRPTLEVLERRCVPALVVTAPHALAEFGAALQPTQTLAPDPITVTAGVPFTDVLAHVSLKDEAGWSVAIDWGDGTPASTGGLMPNARGGYDVVGRHTYAQPGTYTITITFVPVPHLPLSGLTQHVAPIAVSADVVPIDSSPPEGEPPQQGPSGGGPFKPVSGSGEGVPTPGSTFVPPDVLAALLRPLMTPSVGQADRPWTSDASAQSPWLGRIDHALPGLPIGATGGTTPATLANNRSASVAALSGADATPAGASELAQTLPSAPRTEARSLLAMQDDRGILAFLPVSAGEGPAEADQRNRLFVVPPPAVEAGARALAGGEGVEQASEDRKRGPVGWRWGYAALRLTVACCIVHVFHRLSTGTRTAPSSPAAALRRRHAAD